MARALPFWILVITACFFQFRAKDSSLINASYNQFYDWLSSNGAEINGILLTDIGEGERGIVASRDLPAGTVVARLPFKLLPNMAQVWADNALSTLADDRRADQLHDANLMALFLLKHRNNATSLWHAWMSLLPSTFHMPIFWSSSELDELQNSQVHGDTLKRLWHLRRSFALASRLLVHHPEVLPSSSLTWESWLWAHAVVDSRGHTLSSKGPQGKWRTTPHCFVPMVDFFNTGLPSDLNVVCRTNSVSSHFECTTIGDIRKGSELLTAYSTNMSNSRLLLHWGVLLEANPYDDVVLLLGNGLPNLSLTVGNTRSRILLKLATTLRNTVTNAADVAQTALKQQLELYPTTQDADRSLLAHAKVTGHHRTALAISIRMREKEILSAYLEDFTRYVEDDGHFDL